MAIGWGPGGLMRIPGITASAVHSVFHPVNDIAWHAAFWASGNEFAALGLSDGGAVTTFPDEKGTRDATQATASKKPTYRASVASLNNRPVVEFDGVDDALQTASWTGLASSTFVLVQRFLSAAGGTTNIHIDGIASGNRQIAGYNSVGNWAQYSGGTIRTDGASDTNPHFMVGVFAATDTLDKDGSNVISADSGSHTLTGITMGARYDGAAAFGNVQLAFVGLKDGTLTAQEKANLLAWSRSFYGTP